MKKCTKCRLLLDDSKFHKKYGKPIAVCKDCIRPYQHKHYMIHRQERIEKAKTYRLNHSEELKLYRSERLKNPAVRVANIDRCLKHSPHGCGLDKKIRIMQAQENKCFICDEEFSNTKSAHVDHDHRTGMIRGILCTRCNSGLGFFKDNIFLLENAITYLNNNV